MGKVSRNRLIGIVGFALLASSVLTTTAMASAAASSGMASMARADRPVLRNVTTFTTKGNVVPGGGCSVVAPALSLAPGESAVEVDEISVDPATCDARWQKGTPAGSPTGPRSTSTSHLTRRALSKGQRSAPTTAAAAATLHTGGGWFKGWITDAINLELTGVQSNISWTYNNTCVKSGGGSATWTWHGSTGWNPPYNKSVKKYLLCSHAETTADADFNNTGFCWPITTYNKYRNVNVFGTYNGTLYNDGTSTASYSGACAPLYFHWKLQRTA
jgi:hypothetical protein